MNGSMLRFHFRCESTVAFCLPYKLFYSAFGCDFPTLWRHFQQIDISMPPLWLQIEYLYKTVIDWRIDGTHPSPVAECILIHRAQKLFSTTRANVIDY
jgi:hypothetical protein